MFGEDTPGRPELLIVDKPGIYGLQSIDGWRIGNGHMNYVISRIQNKGFPKLTWLTFMINTPAYITHKPHMLIPNRHVNQCGTIRQ